MRVLIVVREFYCSSRPIGGAERQALRLAGELRRQGVSAAIVAGLWDWGQAPRQSLQGVPVYRHFTGWGMFNIRGLRKFGEYLYLLSLWWYLFVHRGDYDVIQCQSAMFEAGLVVLVGRWLSKPALIRPMASGAWGDGIKSRNEINLLGPRWLLSKSTEANAVVALNPCIADEMASAGVPREKIWFISNGIQSVASHRHSYALRNPATIAFVGRLHAQKGVDTLLRALKRVLITDSASWRLELAGRGPLEQSLRAMASQLGVDNHVEFLGQVEDVQSLLARSDLFILPSLAEGMSNALLEAMAEGLPCIATDIPGNRDVIEHRENGLLVHPGDEQGLAEAILLMGRDEAMREKLGNNAARTAQERYSLASVAAQYAALYEHLAKQQAAAQAHPTGGQARTEC